MTIILNKKIYTQSLDIHDAVWDSDWTSLPPKEAKMLTLVMISAQTPFQITVGKFVDFNLGFYCNVRTLLNLR